MKATQPTADLPHLHTPFLNNAMPSRSPRAGTVRNLTGIYLGVEGSTNRAPFQQPPVSQLARGRGMPSQRVRTPAEKKRRLTREDLNQLYLFTPAPASLHGDMNIPCLPPMPQSRYPLVGTQRLVETLRDCEERRGFNPQPIRRRPPGVNTDDDDDQEHIMMVQQRANTFWDLTRQTPRHFTAATNAGVTHLEYLNPDPDGTVAGFYPDAFNVSLMDTMAREVHAASAYNRDQIALVDCYNKICKGNISTLQRMLPNRQQANSRSQSSNRYTGFTVKSYRNPNPAQIIAEFPPLEPRPRTVLGSMSAGRRPFIPSPYFFKTYNSPKTAGDRFQSPLVTDVPTAVPLRSSPRTSNRTAHRQPINETLPLVPQPTPTVRSAVDDIEAPPPTAGAERTLEILVPTDKAGTERPQQEDTTAVAKQQQQQQQLEEEGNASNNNIQADQCSGDHFVVPANSITTTLEPENKSALEGVSGREQNGVENLAGKNTAQDNSTEVIAQENGVENLAGENTAQENSTEVIAQENGVENLAGENSIQENSTTENLAQDETTAEEGVNSSEPVVIKTGGEAARMTGASDEDKVVLQSAAGHKLQKMPSGAEIMIGLEDESGMLKPVEIDETDEVIAQEDSDSESHTPVTSGATTPKRRVSITERVLKQRNSEQQLQQFLEEKENRKRELAELLTEHAHLVHEVETLQEGSPDDSPDNTAPPSPSADKENTTSRTQTENSAEQ